jgi:hypothetical protein
MATLRHSRLRGNDDGALISWYPTDVRSTVSDSGKLTVVHPSTSTTTRLDDDEMFVALLTYVSCSFLTNMNCQRTGMRTTVRNNEYNPEE